MVSFNDFNSPGRHNWIVRELRGARRAAANLERGIARPLLVSNVTPSGQFIGDAQEPLSRVADRLRDCGRLYRQGNAIIFLQGSGDLGAGCAPTPIAVDRIVTPNAPAVLANVIMAREVRANSKQKGAKVDQPTEYELQFQLPGKVIEQVVAADGFFDSIPAVDYITNHPVFDQDFNWLDVGYHPSQRVLVCGDSFEPAILGPVEHKEPAQTVAQALDRLPPLTRRLVEGFAWGDLVDLVNFIGAALMVVLMALLVRHTRPGVMVWANKPGVGKSLLCQLLAILKDGAEAAVTSVESGAREVENQIASELNDGRTVLFLDNQKGTLNIPIIEGNMTDRELAIRAFHSQRKVRRINDLLWLITTNDAVPSEDLLARCIHIQLRYEGEPDSRKFTLTDGELLDFVKHNRAGILAELAGWGVRWHDGGQPSAPADCRFKRFGQVVGSILAFNGLPGFLSNARRQMREHSTKHQQLIAIAERLIDGRPKGFVWEIECDIDKADEEFKKPNNRPEHPMQQRDWIAYLQSAGVIPASCNTPQEQKKAATQYLNGVLKVPVEVDVGEGTVKATIVSRPLGAHKVAYILAVEKLPALPATEGVSAEAAAVEAVLAPAASGPAAPAPTAGLLDPMEVDDGQEGGLWDT